MKLIVGLGNPGPRYETTRHNIGFLAIDRLIDRTHAPSTPVIKNQAETYAVKIEGEPALLIKPLTFMNLSGRSVGPLFKFFKCEPNDLIVIHDDLDLSPLSIRIKSGGGTGGHNGLKSIDQSVGAESNGYSRIRIGIGKPGLRPNGEKELPTEDYVLQPFSNSELKTIDPLLDQVAQAVEMLVHGKLLEAMNQFNRREKETK